MMCSSLGGYGAANLQRLPPGGRGLQPGSSVEIFEISGAAA